MMKGVHTVARAGARVPVAHYASGSRARHRSELARPRQRSTDVFSIFDDLFGRSPFSLSMLGTPEEAFPIDVSETKDAYIVKGNVFLLFLWRQIELSALWTQAIFLDSKPKICA